MLLSADEVQDLVVEMTLEAGPFEDSRLGLDAEVRRFAQKRYHDIVVLTESQVTYSAMPQKIKHQG